MEFNSIEETIIKKLETISNSEIYTFDYMAYTLDYKIVILY